MENMLVSQREHAGGSSEWWIVIFYCLVGMRVIKFLEGRARAVAGGWLGNRSSANNFGIH